MTFEDFLPYVHPSVPTCPVDTVIHHTRLAAIEFCRRAPVWREALDTLLADGFSTDYELSLDDQVELAKLYSVSVDGSGATIVEQLEGTRRIREQDTRLVAFTDNRKRLSVYPVQVLDAEIVVEVALKPSLTAFSFPDEVFAHHVETIAQGALARLLGMPRTEWMDQQAAQLCQARFTSETNKAARHAERGFARSKRRSTTRWF